MIRFVGLSATLITASACTVGGAGTCVGAGDCRPGYVCQDGTCVAAEVRDPRQVGSDAGVRVCSASGGLFRIQHHAADEIDCLVDTFPVWDNPPTVGVLHHGSGWRVRPSMTLTVEATVTIVAPDNLNADELARYKVWYRSQAGEIWEPIERSFIDGEFVAVIAATGEFMLGRDTDALPDVIAWDTGDVSMVDTGRMDWGGDPDVGGFDGAQFPDIGFGDGGRPDYGARFDAGLGDSGTPDVALPDLFAADAGLMDHGPRGDVGFQGPPEGGLPDFGFPDSTPNLDAGPRPDTGWVSRDIGPMPDAGPPPDAGPQPDAYIAEGGPPVQWEGGFIDMGLTDLGWGQNSDVFSLDINHRLDGAVMLNDGAQVQVDGGIRFQDCTNDRNICNQGTSCVQGIANPNEWYCAPACVTQNPATCTDMVAGSCCIAAGGGIQGQCRRPVDCP